MKLYLCVKCFYGKLMESNVIPAAVIDLATKFGIVIGVAAILFAIAFVIKAVWIYDDDDDDDYDDGEW